MKSEFESRISFEAQKHPYKRGKKVFYASVYWNGKLYETIKATKELCIEHLKRTANA